jgi:FAD/FMN-containing dehydrogenase
VTADYPALAATLRAQVEGTVAEPGDEAYDRLVSGFHLAFRHIPPLVVSPASTADVAAVVDAARAAGAPVTALGAGHGFHHGITDGVVVRTRSLKFVEADEAARTVTIGAGSEWQDVLDVIGPLNLLPLSGSDAGVGCVGYLLGGGLGPLGRTYGYGADSVVEFEVVTGEGQILTVDEDNHPDLFWALRGGNHGLGIVTRVTVRVVPDGDVHGDAWFFDAADIEAVLRTWVDWTKSAPEASNTFAHIIRLGPEDEAPPELAGRTLLEVHQVYVGSGTEALAAMKPVLDAAEPVFHEPGKLREETLLPLIVADGGVYLTDLDHQDIDAVLAIAGPDRDVPLAFTGFQHMGGRLGTPQASPNAVAGRDANYAFHIIGADPEAIASGENTRLVQALHTAVARHHASGTIPNYVGPANVHGDVERAWSQEVRARLDAVRAAYDPARVFRNNHTHT